MGINTYSQLSAPDLGALTTPGFYTFSAPTVTSGDCPIESGQCIMIVAGSKWYQMQAIFSHTAAYYRIIASGTALAWHQIAIA